MNEIYPALALTKKRKQVIHQRLSAGFSVVYIIVKVNYHVLAIFESLSVYIGHYMTCIVLR